MKQYLTNLNDRERTMIIIGGLMLILYLYYQFLYAPISNGVNQKSLMLQEKIETLSWMKKVQGQALSAKTKQSLDNNQLLSVLANELKEEENPKYPYQIQQTASGDIQLSFEEVPFIQFMSWLSKWSKKYSIQVKQFNVAHTQTPGVTKLNIIISTL